MKTYGDTTDGKIESPISAVICRGLDSSMSRLRRPQADVNVTKPDCPEEVKNIVAGRHDCTVAITAVDVMVEKTVLVRVVMVKGLKLKKELGRILVMKNFFWGFFVWPNGILAWISGIEESISSSLYPVC